MSILLFPFVALGFLVVAVLVVIYYVLLIMSIVEMLRYDANPFLLIFGLLGLIFLPPLVFVGVAVIIIWRIHRQELPVYRDRDKTEF